MYKTTVPVSVMMRDRAFSEALMRGIAMSWREILVRTEILPDRIPLSAPLTAEERLRPDRLPAAVLTDPDSIDDVRLRYPSASVFAIGDPSLPGGDSFPDVTYLSPFAGAREIGAEILDKLGWTHRFSGEEPFTVFVTSTAGGVGLTSIATALARMIRTIGMGPCLYLSYEPYPLTDRFFRGPGNGRLIGDFLFRLSAKNGRTLPDAFYRESDGVRYFGSDGSWNEILSLGEADERAFLGAVLGPMREGTAVLDVPVPDPARLDALLSEAHLLILVGDGSAETETKNAKLAARFSERYEFLDTIRVINETRPDLLPGTAVREGDVWIPYDPDSMESDVISLEKGFGSGVRELAEKIERIRKREPDRSDCGNGTEAAERTARRMYR